MSDPEQHGDGRPDLLEQAFAAGATDLQIRHRAPYFDDYEVTISAFRIARDPEGRTATQSVSVTELGPTPSAALEAALSKLQPKPDDPVVEATPTARYAVAGRPGQFVSREQAIGTLGPAGAS